ncbi:hypothetical protein N665_0044s0012 [Sinapis alba]|nr:hypothetical protein N665_0044s0012 [Sinapis alba]
MKHTQEAYMKSIEGSMFKYVKKNYELENSDESEETLQYETGNQNDTENQDEEKEQQKKDNFDPGNREHVDIGFKDLMVKKGLMISLSSQYQFPKVNIGRHFLHSFYKRDMVNGGKKDRQRLLYSKALDEAFRFFCKFFIHESGGGNLLKEHEVSHDHVIDMAHWIELELRLQKNQTIDKHAQEELSREKSHWREVLLRIFAVVKTLAQRNLTFRGDSEKLGEGNNGNFLGLIEMIAEYGNGSNMKGKNKGVQKRLLEINRRTFFTVCGCHSLNLVLCDMASSCS